MMKLSLFRLRFLISSLLLSGDNWAALSYHTQISDKWLFKFDYKWERRVIAVLVGEISQEELLYLAETGEHHRQASFFCAICDLADQDIAKAKDKLRDAWSSDDQNIISTVAHRLHEKLSMHFLHTANERENNAYLFIRCAGSFLKRDFESCWREAAESLGAIPRHDVEEMLMISLQQTGQAELAKEFGRERVLNWRSRYGENWTPMIVSHTIGLIGDAALIDAADNDLKLGEALYYVAVKAYCANDEAGALQYLTKLVNLDLESYSVEANMGRLFYLMLKFSDPDEAAVKAAFSRIEKMVLSPTTISNFYVERPGGLSHQFRKYNEQLLSEESRYEGQCAMHAFFAFGDYKKCAFHAGRRLESGINYWIAIIELLSLLRLGKAAAAASKAMNYVDMLENRFGELWYANLIRYIVGYISESELISMADSVEKKYLGFCYIGLRCHTFSDFNTAVEFLQAAQLLYDKLNNKELIETSFVSGTMQMLNLFDKYQLTPNELIILKEFDSHWIKINAEKNFSKQLGLLADLEKILDNAVIRNPNFTFKRLMVLLQYSIRLYDYGKFEDAKEKIDKAFQLLPLYEQDNMGVVYAPFWLQLAKVVNVVAGPPQGINLLEKYVGSPRENFRETRDYELIIRELGSMYAENGQLEKAVGLLDESIDLNLKLHGEVSFETAQSMIYAAHVREQLGMFKQAKPQFEKALLLMKGTYGTENTHYARALNYAARCNKNLGLYPAAIIQYREAIEIVERTEGREYPFYSTLINNIGQLYRAVNDNQNAEAALRESLELCRAGYGERSSYYAVSMRNLSGLLRESGRFEEASSLTAHAVDIWRELYGPEHPEYGQECLNLAIIYLTAGRLQEADRLCETTLTIYKRVFGTEHEDYSWALVVTSEVAEHLGQFDRAFSLLENAVEIARNTPDILDRTSSSYLQRLARLHFQYGNLGAGLLPLTEALAIQDKLLDQIAFIGTEEQRRGQISDLDEIYHLTLSILAVHSDPAVVETLYTFILKRKGVLNDYLNQVHLEALSAADPELSSMVAELVETKQRLYRYSLKGSHSSQEIVETTQLSKKIERLESNITLRHGANSQLFSKGSPDIVQLIGRLDPDVIYLDYLKFQLSIFNENYNLGTAAEAYAVFIFKTGSANVMHLQILQDGLEINHLTHELRRQIITTTTNSYSLKRTSNSLYKKVLEPLLKDCSELEKIAIVPDGILSLLPFQILSTDHSTEKTVIDRFEVTYLSSMRDILRRSDTLQATGPVVIIANPDFSYPCKVAKKLQLFGQLPGTQEEGEAIGKILTIAPVMEEQASREFLLGLHSPKVLHIASHGFFLDYKNPLGEPVHYHNQFEKLSGLSNPLYRSGIALSGANCWNLSISDDLPIQTGLINGEDIASLDLTGTELTVLSACQTGLGDVHDGEGVAGLRKAFAIAGSAALIMSLWSIPDLETMLIMTAFYRDVKNGKSCSSSLRLAQLEIRKRRPHPVFWGGLIYQGMHNNYLRFN